LLNCISDKVVRDHVDQSDGLYQGTLLFTLEPLVHAIVNLYDGPALSKLHHDIRTKDFPKILNPIRTQGGSSILPSCI
jgi:hypothetical protein